MSSDFLKSINSFKSFKINVLGWEKHNQSQRTAKSNTWFKLDHNILDNEKISILSDSAFKLYIVLLCFCSKQNKQIIDINLALLRQRVGSKLATLRHNLDTLAESAIVQVIEIIENGSLHIYRQTEKTDIYTENILKIPIATQKNELIKITDLWLTMLSTFGIERSKPHLQEAQMLDHLKNSYGLENLIQAIIGMAYEQKSESYNPEKFISTKLLSNNFERFLNLGVKNKNDFLVSKRKYLTQESFDLVNSLGGVQNEKTI